MRPAERIVLPTALSTNLVEVVRIRVEPRPNGAYEAYEHSENYDDATCGTIEGEADRSKPYSRYGNTEPAEAALHVVRHRATVCGTVGYQRGS